MKPTKLPRLIGVLLGATCALSQAAVLFTSSGSSVDQTSIDLNVGISRDGSATGTLYFKYTVTNPASNSSTENYFAAMQLYEGAAERIGIGNSWNFYAYSAYGTSSGDLNLKSANPEPGEIFQLVRSTDTTTIVFRIDFVSGGNDTITAWLNPDLGLTEAAQNTALTTSFTGNATFDEVFLREGGGGSGWNFSNIAIAENSTDTGFFAAPVPETSTSLIAALGLMTLLRRKR